MVSQSSPNPETSTSLADLLDALSLELRGNSATITIQINPRPPSTTSASPADAAVVAVTPKKVKATDVAPTPMKSQGSTSDVEEGAGDTTDPSVRWFVVTVGKQVGVFAGWDRVSPLVLSVSGSSYTRETSRATAEAVFASALAERRVRLIR